MLINNRLFAISVLLLIMQLPMLAQNNTNSPYTRFGYGQLADRSFGAGRAMGGIGYGLRSSRQINPMNPASYTSIDTLTFIFDVGASGQLSWFTDGSNKQHNMNGNIEYIAMEFPVSRRIAMSAGILPYSYVGYSFGSTQTQGSTSWGEIFKGTGGLNDFYVGLSMDIWKKRLSLGLNGGFLFGNITHYRNLSFTTGTAYSVTRERRIEVRDMKLDFGLQYTHPISAKENLIFGLTFSPANQLHAHTYNIQQVGTATLGYTSDTIRGQRLDIPNSIGFGASYVKTKKVTLAADVLYENWSNSQFFSEKGQFRNRVRIAGGGEWLPDYSSRSLLKRTSYRAGAHYTNSYLRVNNSEGSNIEGKGYDEYGASVGFGMPLIDNRSLLNISFEYVKVHPEVASMISEQYFRFTVNYTFNELWFFKRKVD